MNIISSSNSDRSNIQTQYSDNGNIMSVSSSVINPLTSSQYLDLPLTSNNFTSSYINNIIDTTIYELIDPNNIINTPNNLTLIPESTFNYLNATITSSQTTNTLNKLEYNSNTGSLEREYNLLIKTIDTTNIIFNTILQGTINVPYKNNIDIKQDLESVKYIFSASTDYILKNYKDLYSRIENGNTIQINVKQELNSNVLYDSTNLSSHGIYYNNYNIPSNENFKLGKYFPIYLNANVLPTSSTLRNYSTEYNTWLDNLYLEIIDLYNNSKYIRTYFDSTGKAYSCKAATYIPTDRPFYINLNNKVKTYYIGNNSYFNYKQGHLLYAFDAGGNAKIIPGIAIEKEYTYKIISSDIYNNTEFNLDSEIVSGSACSAYLNIDIGWLANFNKVNLQINLKDKNSSGFEEWASLTTFNIRDVYNNYNIIDTIKISDCYDGKVLILSESKYDIQFNTTDTINFSNASFTYIDKNNNEQYLIIDTNKVLEFDVFNYNAEMAINFNMSLSSIDLTLNSVLELPQTRWSVYKLDEWNSYFVNNNSPKLEIYKNNILYSTYNYNKNTGYIDDPTRILKVDIGTYTFKMIQPESANSNFYVGIAELTYRTPNSSVLLNIVYLPINTEINGTTFNITQEDTNNYEISLRLVYEFYYNKSIHP